MKLRSGRTMRLKTSRTQVDPNDRWGTLNTILERGGPQTSETDLSYQVIGIYSLPESWLKLQQSGSVDTWQYVVNLSDAILENGKLHERELTEEEKAEMDNKKKPPPKINKKDPAAVKAEEDRLAQEQKEKEEKEKAFQEQLDKLSPEEQFYFLKELPTKEAWIAFPEDNNVSMVKKESDKLIEFEEDVNVNEGLIIQVNFIPPPDDDPKKRPKPKGINPEDVHPIYCIGWVDCSELHKNYGLTELTLRVNLQLRETYENRIDIIEKRDGVKYINPNNENILNLVKENEEENLDEVEKAKTYIYIKIGLTFPVNPLMPDMTLPEPIDFIKNESKTKKAVTVEEIENDLIRQFKIAIAAIAKTYDEAMGDSAKGQLVRREKGNILSNAKREEKENNINKFLDKFNTSGRADLLKEKLKKFIVRIVLEKYNKKGTSVKGVFKDKRDQFYSELYAYLTDSVKKATDEFVKLKKDELHEHILVTFNQSKKEIMNYAIRQNKEPEDKRLLRLSKENELLDDYKKAVQYFKARLLLDSNKDAWLSYMNLAKKIDDLPEVEKALKNAASIDITAVDLNTEIIFCGLLYLKDQISNAINFMNLYIFKNEIKGTSCNFNAFLAFLYKEKMNQNPQSISKQQTVIYELLFKKHLEAAKLFKMKSLPPEELHPAPEEKPPEEEVPKDPKKDNKKQPPPVELSEEELKAKEEAMKRGNPRIHFDYKPNVLDNKQIDSIWFDLINLFNSYNFYEISEKLLDYFSEETKQDLSFKTLQAKILLLRKNYDKVIELTNEIIEQQFFSYEPYLLQGHAYYYKKNYEEAEQSYIKAIRFKPQEKQFDLEMMVKLGNVYIKNEKWYEAKVVYKQILRNSVEHSFAWRFLGFTLTKLGEYDEAEKALTQANLLDVENPLIWAYLTIFCIYTNRKNQALQCLNELNKVNFNDKDILIEIAKMFEDMKEYEICANIYKKILLNERTNPEFYIKIAEIYYTKIEGKKKEALEILEKGRERVYEDNLRTEIVNMIDKIKKENENEMIGEESNKDLFKYDKVNKDENEVGDLNISESQLKDADFLDDEEGGQGEFKEEEEKDKDKENENENKNENENENKNDKKKEEEVKNEEEKKEEVKK